MGSEQLPRALVTFADHSFPAYSAAQMLAFAATAREQALREAAEVANQHALGAWDVAAAEGQNAACASGRNYGARAVETAILSLIAKEPVG